MAAGGTCLHSLCRIAGTCSPKANSGAFTSTCERHIDNLGALEGKRNCELLLANVLTTNVTKRQISPKISIAAFDAGLNGFAPDGMRQDKILGQCAGLLSFATQRGRPRTSRKGNATCHCPSVRRTDAGHSARCCGHQRMSQRHLPPHAESRAAGKPDVHVYASLNIDLRS
jgi:hypothetical protein